LKGEQAGLHGVVEEVAQEVVTITAHGLEIDGQKMEIPARSVRKRFKPGDHVKVMAGQNTDETGLVVSVADNVVTFVSDMLMQEVFISAYYLLQDHLTCSIFFSGLDIRFFQGSVRSCRSRIRIKCCRKL
jgi:transcription elongation factor